MASNFGYGYLHTPQISHYKKIDNLGSSFNINRQYPYDSKTLHEIRKKDWIDRSVDYYFRVVREKSYISSSKRDEERIDNLQPQQTRQQVEIATRLYFARTKIKSGSPQHAEYLYRKIIDEIMSSEKDEYCDHSALAVSTLLLALLLQRMGDIKGTRSVFLNFFRVIQADEENNEGDEDCACSAKVLQAFALFEMKCGNSMKSFELIKKAINMDKSLERILKWKQFRDASIKSSLRASLKHN